MNPFAPIQRGFAAISAIFLLVVLAALGAFIVSVSSSQQVGSAQDVQGSRAYWAANAGIEWAIASLAAAPTACPTPPSPFVVEGFALTISCSAVAFDEAGVARTLYSIGSRAAYGATPGAMTYIERSLSASVEF